MAIFKPIHVVESKLGNVSKVAGQLIITTDVGNIYFDASTSNRILIANKYTLPVATQNALGGIKSGAALSVDSSGNVTITANGHTHTVAQLSDLNVSAGEINQLKGVVSNVQNQLDSKVNKTQTINGYSLNKDISLTANDVNAVPKTRRINGKELSSDISLTAANVGAIATDQRGASNGVASLVGGKIPENQIPTSFDEVIFGYFSNGKFYKESTLATSITGESGKIYIDLNSNGFYIYKDSVFSEAASNLKLGTTSTTAFRGDYGNTLYTNLMKTVGSATKGIYFNNGVPTAMTYAVNKDVPSDAVFVDTHYTTGAKVGASATATANAATSNGSTYLNILDNTTVRDSHLIKGIGATTVTSDANGTITISSTDTNTTYSAATQNTAGLMSTSDKTKLDGIATGANKYILPVAGASLGGVKSGTDITVDASGNVSVNDNSHAHTTANITDLQSKLDAKLDRSSRGVANGLATLDSSGHVPTSQLPSYVDDVLEFNTKSGFPKTGEAGKIYVDLTTNLTYRWSGTEYVEISPSIALGRTSSTAFPGDAGKALEDKINKTVGSTSKPVYLNNGTFTECGSSLGVSVTGNAATVTNTFTDSASGTWYRIPFVTGSGSQGLKINSTIEYYTIEGTTSQLGRAILALGNGTTSGTAGNKYGAMRLYGQNVSYTDLISSNVTSPITITLPSGAGTLARTIDNVESATKLKTARTINGTSFDGTANITTTNWGTSRNISISSSDGTNAGSAVGVNGGANVTLKLPSTIKATLDGKAASADKLNTNAGSASQPVYFTGGKPAAITNLEFNNNGVTVNSNGYTLSNHVKGIVGGNDYWRIGGGATANDEGYLEISTADNGNEPIYVRQYASAYTSAPKRTLTLLDGSGNTSIPGALNVTGATTLSSTLNVTGIITGSDEIRSTSANAFRAITGNYGFIIRNDGQGVYFLLTNSGAPTGSYNSLRPLSIHCSTGNVIIGTPLSITNTLAVSGTSTFTGRTIHDGKITIPSTSGQWITGKTGTNASINISTVQSTSDYHPYLAVTAKDGHVFNIGGYINQVGFYGYYSSRKDNGTDWKFYVDTDNGNWFCDKKITATGGFTGNLNGNAATVTSTTTNPTSDTWYNIPFVTSSGSQGLKVNDGLAYHTQEGTASEIGLAELMLGNSTNSGTARNKRGQLKLYGQGTGPTYLIPANITSSINVTLPSGSGTLARTVDNVASATKVTTTNNNTRKVYLTGTDGAGTQSLYYDTGVYLSTTGGRLETGSISVGATSSQAGPATLQYDSSYKCIKFVFS